MEPQPNVYTLYIVLPSLSHPPFFLIRKRSHTDLCLTLPCSLSTCNPAFSTLSAEQEEKMGEKGDNWIRGILESHPKKEATGDRDEKESVNRGRFGGAGSDQACGERREL